MSCEQLIHRMLSAQTLELGEGVEISSIATGILSEYETYTLGRVAEELQVRNVYINKGAWYKLCKGCCSCLENGKCLCHHPYL